MMTVSEFIQEYEYMSGQGDYIEDDEVLREVYKMVIGMFNDNCGYVPDFELVNGGKKIKLLTKGI